MPGTINKVTKNIFSFRNLKILDLCMPKNVVIFLDFHSTKQGLPLVDSWSHGLD